MGNILKLLPDLFDLLQNLYFRIKHSGILSRFFHVSLDMFCICDMEGKLIQVNHSFAASLGYQKEDLEGQLFMQFVHEADVAKTTTVMGALQLGANLRGFKNRYICADKTTKTLEWTCKVYREKIYAAARIVPDEVAG